MKNIFLALFLLISIDLEASPSLEWFDSNEAKRTLLDLQNGKIHVEKLPGQWEVVNEVDISSINEVELPRGFHHHTFVDPTNNLIFTIDGTGIVFELDFGTKQLKRIDKTYFRGFNFGATVFTRKNVIYSFGGSGFWNYSHALTYFDSGKMEWEILRPTNKGPLGMFNGFQGYDKSTDSYFSGGSEYGDFLAHYDLIIQKELYQFNFRQKHWELLGELNSILLNEKSRDVFWTGTYFVQFSRNKVYIIEPKLNKVYQFESPKELFQDGGDTYIVGNKLYQFWDGNSGANQVIDIKGILHKSKYIGPFYTKQNPVFWYVGLSIFLVFIFLFTWMKLKKRKIVILDLTMEEKKLIQLLLSKEELERFSTVELNEVLGLDAKSIENQRKIRTSIIASINQKIYFRYSIPNAIERSTATQDRRLTLYHLKAEAYRLIK